MIPYGRHSISDEDIEAVVRVLRSDFLTQGPRIPEFELQIAKKVNANFAVAVNSATSALHLACLALGVKRGDVVWTSPITFVASANCARYCGAQVDFIDIDTRTYNLSIIKLEEKLELAKKEGRLPKVVIPVHLAGQSCEMSEIKELSKKYHFRIIEDASHAVGGMYKGEPIGNCKYSDISVFSFHPVKIITTGEGGVAVTNDAELNHRMARLRSHGITRSQEEMTIPSEGDWFYQQLELGYNYRMTDLQAALGISQLQRLDEFVSKRHDLASNYDKLLKGKPVISPFQHKDSYSAFHLYIVRLKLEEINVTHRQVFERLRSHGIQVNLHYIPVYRHPYYAKMGYKRQDFPEAEAYYSEAISLPLYPDLTFDQQELVVERLLTPLGHQTIF
ncbi:UDP-4-amino-4,6-dideoxy-N-acetyl-beta-L-altrosamine transaminase [Leptospira levettii]|nr:UDP-4-amino-4,6-dideoxy-N-acetyl-beta-L-altrosamine transaminase [Leptospira levettii]